MLPVLSISLTVSAHSDASRVTQHASADCFDARLLGLGPADEAINLSAFAHISQISLDLTLKLD